MVQIEQYTPTNLKQLFNRNVVGQLKKKLSNLSKKTLIFVNGPLGCGKTVSMKLLLKKFNVININPDDSLFIFADGYHKTFSNKQNILLIDQAELFEKQVLDFVRNVHIEKSIDIPIIVVTNNMTQHESFNKKEHTYSIYSFGKPSLLELYKVIYDINTKEILNLKDEDIREIIKTANGDIQFILNILQHWSLSLNNNTSFNKFIHSYGQKDKVLSPHDLILNSDIHDFHTLYKNSIGHSFAISNLIYENLPSLVDDISIYSEISECMSYSEKIVSDKYFWEVYNIHAINSCIIPLSIMQSNGTFKLECNLQNFKDIPSNYLNSLNIVYKNTNIPTDLSSCSQICQLFCFSLNQLSLYVNEMIKITNVSKKSIVQFCSTVENAKIKEIMDYLVNNIIYFNLFEYTDYIPLNNDHNQIIKLFQNVKLNILKRFLNIFTIQTNYTLSSKTECVLKYEIFKKLMKSKQTTIVNSCEAYQHADLSSIWNL